jgi:hypothetical protein
VDMSISIGYRVTGKKALTFSSSLWGRNFSSYFVKSLLYGICIFCGI